GARARGYDLRPVRRLRAGARLRAARVAAGPPTAVAVGASDERSPRADHEPLAPRTVRQPGIKKGHPKVGVPFTSFLRLPSAAGPFGHVILLSNLSVTGLGVLHP